MAAIGGCAGFGAISGSSLATAATMGQVALPELRRYNYSGALATGALAAGGTLGILIPPSVVLIIYAIIVEANIATLFQAALLPGILAALGYMAAIAIVVRIDPEAGPAGARATTPERWLAVIDIWPVIVRSMKRWGRKLCLHPAPMLSGVLLLISKGLTGSTLLSTKSSSTPRLPNPMCIRMP